MSLLVQKKVPLADYLRPTTLDEVVGQDHLLGSNGIITCLVKQKHPISILLWGPPGCGKTTLARLYAKEFNAHFVSFSAVLSGIADLRRVVKESKEQLLFNRQTVLFVDEIHRFNKAQQDAFLPYLEDGTMVLVGATTENPSFALNNALLSRISVLPLNALNNNDLKLILEKYESKMGSLPLTENAKSYLITLAHGDGRYLLNMIESLAGLQHNEQLDVVDLKPFLQKRVALFDKLADGHYNLISALHKSIRGSDPDASLYWFARIIEGGEDPLYIARRLIRVAAEDIGLADPESLKITIAARDAYNILGSPEGELILAEAVIYLALSPKSNAIYTAYEKAKKIADDTNNLNPPKTILNAPTKLMKQMEYGKDYIYDHNTPNGFSGQNYFPEELGRHRFYIPVHRGFEREMAKRLEYFQGLREKINRSGLNL